MSTLRSTVEKDRENMRMYGIEAADMGWLAYQNRNFILTETLIRIQEQQ